MASSLTSASTLAVDILARFPAEIITRIVDNLHPSLIYFRLFVEPKSSPAQSSSVQCQRVRDICISHNVKFGRIDILTYAISSNDLETVKQLLQEATTNATTSGKKDTVMEHATRSLWKLWFSWSVSENFLDVASQILRVDGIGSYLNGKDRTLDKLLLLAAKDYRDASLMRLLLENGANPDINDDSIDTPLVVAAKHNNSEAIELLVVQYQADVNRLGSGGNTPLMWAIENGDTAAVKPFLQSPLLDLNKKSILGQTALHRALSKGKPKIAELLLTWDGVLEENKDTHGKTPLMLCLDKMAGLRDMTKYMPTFKGLLVAKGVDPQAFSEDYETVFEDHLGKYDPGFWQELVEQMDS
ncbi:ankyrin repeat protein [Trichoderma barbatum]